MSKSVESTPPKVSDELQRQDELGRLGGGQGSQGSRTNERNQVLRSVSILAIRAGLITIAIYFVIIALTIYPSAGGPAPSWARTTDLHEQTNCSPICPSGYRLDRVVMPVCTWNCVSWTSLLWPLGAGKSRVTWHGAE